MRPLRTPVVRPLLALSYAVVLLGLVACDRAASPGTDANAATDTASSTAVDAQPAGDATAVSASPAWPQSDRDVRPLLPGNPVPASMVRTLDGESLRLSDALEGKPAVLVFYRGGWCPFCNVQLSGLRLIREDLDAIGFQLIAISPDDPAHLRKTLDGQSIDYRLLSDSQAEAMRAFGIGYQVDAATREKLSGYGIDLSAASGADHHVLPVPAVFVVDEAGTIQFAYAHPDYKVRLPQDVVLAAAKAVKEQRHLVKPKG